MRTADLTRHEWRRIAVSAYLPTLLSSVGFGAITPLVALTARQLGASVGMAAFVVGVLGIGSLVGDLPAGAIASRWGEKRAIVGACLVDATALMVAFGARSVLLLGAAVFVCGLAGAVFGLSRQTYLTEAIPLRYRARSLSTMGGVFRIGFFIGPLLGAAVISAFNLTAAYAFSAGMSLLAASITMALPDLPAPAAQTDAQPRLTVWTVLRQHTRVLATIGVGAMALMMVRSARQSIIPLWCEAIGMGPAATSLVFALSALCDIALFYPGGAVMDRFGRSWVAVPAMVVLGVGFVLLPLARSEFTVAAVAALLGFGNGIGSGVVMTLGSDASPAIGRPQFLSGWRLCGDLGSSIGPLLITAVTAVGPLAAAAVLLGAVAWAGAGWLAAFVPDSPVRRRLDARAQPVSAKT